MIPEYEIGLSYRSSLSQDISQMLETWVRAETTHVEHGIAILVEFASQQVSPALTTELCYHQYPREPERLR